MEYALQLLIPILLGLYLGNLLDQKTGQQPLYTLIGFFIGMLGGIGIMYKRAIMVQEALKQEKEAKNKDNPQ